MIECIEKIIEAKNEQRLCLFVGAGISMSVKGMPSWSDLIRNIQKDLSDDTDNDYLKVAQVFYSINGKDEYYKKIKKFFDEKAEPSIIHKAIFSLEPNIIITTNWDCLLEKEAKNGFHLYDTVVNDDELIKSNNPKKIIKMHGDLLHENIVFKEDDYTGYENDFPLISNYIKGLLATNVIVFIGYSYQDINLKFIMNWLNRNSKVRLPMFMISLRESKIQTEYLKSQGITNVIIKETDSENKLDILDDKSNMIYNFFENINNFNNVDRSDPIDYIFNKIKKFESLNYILRADLVREIGNCGLLYKSGKCLIAFYNSTLTYDFNKDDRISNENFLNAISKNNFNYLNENIKLKKINKILLSSGIDGISNNERFANIYHTLSADYSSEKYFKLISYDNVFFDSENIDDNLHDAHVYFRLNRYEDCLKLLEIILECAIKENRYDYILIASSNYKDVYRIFESSNNKKEYKKNKYIKDMDGYYNSFPFNEKNKFKFLYESMSENIFYKHFYNSGDILHKEINSIKSNTFYFDDTRADRFLEYENFLKYYIGNNILTCKFSDFTNVVKNYIRAIFYSNYNGNVLFLNKTMIFSLIDFFDDKGIIELFALGRVVKIKNNNLDWLILIVIKNLSMHPRSYIYNSNKMSNVFFVLSFIKLGKKRINLLMDIVSQMVRRFNLSIQFYKSVNFFILKQHELFGNVVSFNKRRYILEVLISKVFNRNTNAYECLFIDGCYWKDFIFGMEDKIKVNNVRAVRSFLERISNYDNEYKMNIINERLLVIYPIFSDNIKSNINLFINSMAIDFKAKPSVGILFFLLKASMLGILNDFFLIKNIYSNILKKTLYNESFDKNLIFLELVAEDISKIRNNLIYIQLYKKLLNRNK